MTRFDELGLHPVTLKAIAAMGFEQPTPIQEAVIPLLIQGEDLIGQAKTGTGKTAAFGIPLKEASGLREFPPSYALVLVPTRELCQQVTQELNRIGKGSPFTAAAVYGGVGYNPQKEALTGRTTVIVATPGRLMDHMERGYVRCNAFKVVILDEADRMLDMGFIPDVRGILKQLHGRVQTALFSATMPDEIRRLSEEFLRHPEFVKVSEDELTTEFARQFAIEIPAGNKVGALLALLRDEKPEKALIFVNTKHGVRRLARTLRSSCVGVEELHGDLTQAKRTVALNRFREGEATILVATDVAARGLDVPKVSHVINYDLPNEPLTYVHRVGRTGRMGREGRAFTLHFADERRLVDEVSYHARVELEAMQLTNIPPPLKGYREGRSHGPPARRGGGRPRRGGRPRGARSPGAGPVFYV